MSRVRRRAPVKKNVVSKVNNNNRKKDSKNRRRRKGGRNGGRKTGSISRIAILLLFIAFVGVGACGSYAVIKFKETQDTKFKPVNPIGEKPDSGEDVKEPVKEPKVYDFEESELYTYNRKIDDDRYKNILIMGIDGENQETSIDAYTRTDVMMLMSIDEYTNKINLIGIPRDTYVEISGSKTNKINSAHAIGGPEAAARAVANLLDTQVDDYIKINYNAFRQFVDAIGGVDVHIKEDMVYDDEGQDLKIRFYKGEDLTLYGEDAEKFVRWRKNNADYEYQSEGSDYSRMQRMKYFIGQVMKKLTNPSITKDLINIVNSVTNNIRHTFGEGEIFDFIYDRNELMEGLNMITLPTIEENRYAPDMGSNQSYMIVDNNKIMDTLKLMHGDGYLNKRYLKIKIENCSGKPGLAANFADFLKLKGYGDIELTDGTNRENSEVLMDIQDEYMKKVFSDEVNMENIKDDSYIDQYYDVIIRLGKDHDRIRF